MVILAVFLQIGCSSLFAQMEYNWIAPPPKTQLKMEQMDDIKGLGRLFLPAMTNSDFEPVYTVWKGDSIIREQKMGLSVWLRPGEYTVAFGSGNIEQMIKKKITIQAQETKMIEPDWSGLTIRILNEVRDWIKEPYEIFRLPEREAFGIGYGADQQLGEKLQTWILKPGLYKIVKLGENVNTFINFTTVRLIPGELTQYTIVMDSETKNYIGSGVLLFESESRRIRNWSVFSALYGSLTLNHANDVTSEEQETSMAFVAQLDYNIKYSTQHHYFLARGLFEEGWNMQPRETNLRSYLDNVRLKNLYIFYFSPVIGAYGRFFLDTNLFRTVRYYDDPTNLILIERNGTETTYKNLKQVELSPPLSPLELKEGIGLNIQFLKSLRANFNVRLGMGFRQNINTQLYTQDTNSDSVFYRKSSSYLRGPEASLIGNYRIFKNMMITSEIDLLMPSGSETVVYDWENNINLRLTQNVSLDYTIRIKRDESIVPYVQSEQILLLRYSYSLF